MTDNNCQKVIWITGASSGIGEALAYAYSKRNQLLILSSRRAEALRKVKLKCPYPSNIRILPLDLGNQEDMERITTMALGFFGRVDIIINSGGISQRSLVKETSLAVDRKIMEVNFFGTIALSKALLKTFIVNQTGHFVVISSIVGKLGTPYRSSYAASKHALHGFFDTLRAEHSGDNINVTLVCPGFVRTDISVNALMGDGSTHNLMDEGQKNGISPEVCANKIIHAINRKKEETYIGGKEVFAVYLKRFFPSLLSKIIKKVKVR